MGHVDCGYSFPTDLLAHEEAGADEWGIDIWSLLRYDLLAHEGAFTN
ncbi:MAG: hypothetical protein R6U17_08260 [Thermoplasmata archaeon]